MDRQWMIVSSPKMKNVYQLPFTRYPARLSEIHSVYIDKGNSQASSRNMVVMQDGPYTPTSASSLLDRRLADTQSV